MIGAIVTSESKFKKRRREAYPLSFRLQIEGDAEIQAKLRGVTQSVQELGQKTTGIVAPTSNAGKALQQTGAQDSNQYELTARRQ